MSDEPQRPHPAKGAVYYPDEGGITYAGQTFYPADYGATSRDNDPLLRDAVAAAERRGAEQERAAVVAMIRAEAGEGDDAMGVFLRTFATAIKAGEHREKGQGT